MPNRNDTAVTREKVTSPERDTSSDPTVRDNLTPKQANLLLDLLERIELEGDDDTCSDVVMLDVDDPEVIALDRFIQTADLRPAKGSTVICVIELADLRSIPPITLRLVAAASSAERCDSVNPESQPLTLEPFFEHATRPMTFLSDTHKRVFVRSAEMLGTAIQIGPIAYPLTLTDHDSECETFLVMGLESGDLLDLVEEATSHV